MPSNNVHYVYNTQPKMVSIITSSCNIFWSVMMYSFLKVYHRNLGAAKK